jgi:hypothetical protein
VEAMRSFSKAGQRSYSPEWEAVKGGRASASHHGGGIRRMAQWPCGPAALRIEPVAQEVVGRDRPARHGCLRSRTGIGALAGQGHAP